ncbi:hypothetical protein V1512DRAFT_257850 [Lipomyces arxii]|uniref:uncharacterized protein n=1 Tax=Lipomyces arxii TaxID=56418 RepID=UPI0034CF2859
MDKPPLNPFLAALFHPLPHTPRTRDLATALQSPRNYVLLVPITASLLFTIDSETGTPFAELCKHEDFLAAHIIKIGVSAKAAGQSRIFWTLNQKSILIRDDTVLSSKGFKSVTRARILADRVYTTTSDLLPYDTQFLVYYISRPLIGTAQPLYDFRALPSLPPKINGAHATILVTTFSQLLSEFPLIGRQMQGPLIQVFESFNCSDATEPDLVTMIEEVMEKGIALFQAIDHSVVNAMASSTGLTGPEIEKMLEDYVGTHLHSKIWPRLTVLRSLKDSIISAAVKNMKCVGLGQLGIQPYWVEDGDSIERMVMTAVTDLEKLSKSDNARAQVDDLVKILRNLGVVPPSDSDNNGDEDAASTKESKEKSVAQSNMSADVLVSLMIIVVTWSKLDNLDSHLFYMRNFSFMDVDTGEVGYALSTFEAVIFHIMNNSSKLAVVSSANQLFWKAIRDGKDLAPAFENPGEYFGAGGIDVSEIESLEQVYQSRNSLGESAIMMAVQAPVKNVNTLKHLLSKRDVFPIEAILKDQNGKQTTLLSAALQTGDQETVDAVWTVLSENYGQEDMKKYFSRKDEWQRSIGHYLFNIPDLITAFGNLIVWADRDQNGQTPLFALCRSYDHTRYTELVKMGVDAATKYQIGGGGLRFLDHVDSKGNTLLHIMKDIPSLKLLLSICDIDLNRVNDKGLTPLMVNSKFSRISAIELMTSIPEVDISRRNFRGLCAAELAKDENIRSRIDDITLFRQAPVKDGRITSVLRGYLLDDSVHFIIKSGVPPSRQSITSVRRSYTDFTFVERWLRYEMPASWMPTIPIPHNPFAIIPTRPAKSVAREVQYRLDSFMRTLLLHPSFSTHELLWEFFLVSDFSRELSEKRSKQKFESRKDMLEEDYPPLENTDEAVVFFNHALREMNNLEQPFLHVVNAAHGMHHKRLDLAEAYLILQGYMRTVSFLPLQFIDTLTEFANLYQVTDTHLDIFVQELRTCYAAVTAVMESLTRPNKLIDALAAQSSQLQKFQTSLNRSSTRFPLGLLNETRSRYANDATLNIRTAEAEISRLGSEIRYSQTVLASELGGFNEMHEIEVMRIIKEYATEKMKWEKVRLKGMKAALNKIKF